MGKIGIFIEEFLDNGGRDNGFTETSMPSIKDMDNVLKHDIKAWEYFGMSQEEYYNGGYTDE
jgi:hypothetical protein